MPKRCVLFDLDGTLLDTAPDFIYVLNTMRKEQSLIDLDAEIIRTAVSGGAREMVKAALGASKDEVQFEKNVSDFLTRYNHQVKSHQSRSCLFAGMDELIHTIESRNNVWGIVTNKPERYSAPLMSQLKLTPHVLICPDHVKHTKPSPEPLLLACKMLKCKPSESIYVGDHQRDIESGRAAKMETVVANWGYFSEQDPKQAWQADWLANQPSDILTFL